MIKFDKMVYDALKDAKKPCTLNDLVSILHISDKMITCALARLLTTKEITETHHYTKPDYRHKGGQLKVGKLYAVVEDQRMSPTSVAEATAMVNAALFDEFGDKENIPTSNRELSVAELEAIVADEIQDRQNENMEIEEDDEDDEDDEDCDDGDPDDDEYLTGAGDEDEVQNEK